MGRLLEKPLGVMSCRFGVGQNSGQGTEARVLDDLPSVLRNGPVKMADVLVGDMLGWPTLSEGSQR